MLAILLCTLNGEDFILEQLNSIKDQTFKDFDLYIKDNFSEDKTRELIDKFKSENDEVNISYLEGDGGHFANSYIQGLHQIDHNYKFYAFCDQDDVWENDHLERSVEFLKKNTNKPSVYCSRTSLINDKGAMIGKSLYFKRPASFRNALVQSIAGANTMIFNDQALNILKKVDLNKHIISHDWLLYILVTANNGNFFYDLEPSVRYRQHNNNLIGSNLGIINSLKRMRLMLKGQFRLYNIHNLNHLDDLRNIKDNNIKFLSDYKKSIFCKKYKRPYFFIKSRVYRQSTLGNIALFISIFFGDTK